MKLHGRRQLKGITETTTVEQLGRALLRSGRLVDEIFTDAKDYRTARVRHRVWQALRHDCKLSYQQIANMFPACVSDRSTVRYGIRASVMGRQ